MSIDAAQSMDDMGTSHLPGRDALEMGTLRQLSVRSDWHGLLRIAGHFAYLGVTGYLIYLAWAQQNYWLLVPAMLLHGFGIVTMFAPMHECVHRTAFSTPRLNEIFGWIAGALAFYNFTFYRCYHTWHHRYTQDPKRDPELSSPPPKTVGGYLWELSGMGFWIRKPTELITLALGYGSKYPFIPERAQQRVALSAAVQLLLYSGLLFFSLIYRTPVVLMYWLLPAIIAQPLLRAMLIVEHTGCTYDENGLTNTRTTLASWPVRFLMWNMPFHAEHHLYPSIPFFRLPDAHQNLKRQIAHVASSYPAANRDVMHGFK